MVYIDGDSDLVGLASGINFVKNSKYPTEMRNGFHGMPRVYFIALGAIMKGHHKLIIFPFMRFVWFNIGLVAVNISGEELIHYFLDRLENVHCVGFVVESSRAF